MKIYFGKEKTNMKKKEFKEHLLNLLSEEVEGMSINEKLNYIKNILLKYEIDNTDFDLKNKGKSWTDDELRLILKLSPTKENILYLAKAFKRGYGSIEQIYRWAAEDQKIINEKRPNDKFIQQIKKIAKEVGWRAT